MGGLGEEVHISYLPGKKLLDTRFLPKTKQLTPKDRG